MPIFNSKKSIPDLPCKKIALCYHFFPHYRKGIIEEILKELPVDFVGDDKGVEGIKTFNFPNSKRFSIAKCTYFGKLMFQPKILWIALTGNYSTYIFLANPNHITTWIGAAICRIRNKRVVFWGHGFKSQNQTKSNKIRKAFFSLANAFYTYGYNAKKNALSMGFNEKDIHVGFNSLDYSSQISVRNHLQYKPLKSTSLPDTLNISCISRLTYTCRYDLLFDAIALAQKSSSVNYKVTIIGDGPERLALENQAKKLEINGVFLGPIYEEQKIAEILYNSDVTISPGKIGLTAMHSLMYGTPVISHDDIVSQMPEVEAIVPGRTGELFRHNDLDSLTEILISFPTRFRDRNKTRNNCFAMMDRIYNPKKQLDVLKMAIDNIPATKGDDAFNLFNDETHK